eukprot:scaffold299907_cov34-Prasinocladus_malaysianus.AAC.1
MDDPAAGAFEEDYGQEGENTHKSLNAAHTPDEYSSTPSASDKKFRSKRVTPSPSCALKTKTWSEIDENLAERDNTPVTRSRRAMLDKSKTPPP